MQAAHLFAENSHLKKLISQDLFSSDKAQEGTAKVLASAGCQASCLAVNVKLTSRQGSSTSLLQPVCPGGLSLGTRALPLTFPQATRRIISLPQFLQE